MKKHDREAVIFKTLLKVKKAYGLKDAEIIRVIGISDKEYSKWILKNKVDLENPAVKTALIYFIRIFVIELIFHDDCNKKEWLRTEHPFFKKTPLDVMTAGLEGLESLHAYLDKGNEYGF